METFGFCGHVENEEMRWGVVLKMNVIKKQFSGCFPLLLGSASSALFWRWVFLFKRQRVPFAAFHPFV